MRPLVLEISAFGPFAKKEVVDFRRLDGRDLLLIEGPTGAGKTSILDAMTYALFGAVPGARDEIKDELRSGYADGKSVCEISFEFQLGERRYRVHRVPAQARGKRRGLGTTRQPAEARLFELRDEGGVVHEWPLCPSRIPDVDAAVQGLLGLSVAQFKQVLLLPQGDFRQFLLARSSEKEPLLEQLFGTTLYKKIADELADERKALERRAEELTQARGELLGHGGASSPGELDGLIVGAGETVAAVAAVADEAAVQAKLRQEAHAAAASVAARFTELDCARELLAGAEKEAQTVATLGAKLERADRAEPLRTPFQRAELERTRAAKLAAEAAACGETRKQADATLARLARQVGELPSRRARLEELTARDAVLSGLAPIEQKARVTRAGFLTLETARLVEVDKVRTLEQQARTGREELAGVDAELVKVRLRAEGVVLLTEQAAAIDETRRRRLELETARGVAVTARTAAAKAAVAVGGRTETLAAARSDTAQHRRDREEGLAAELAENLQAGKPCPVCGSGEHPAPARGSAARVSAADVAAAQKREDDAVAQAALAATAHARLDAAAHAAEEKVVLLTTALVAIAAEPVEAVVKRAEQARSRAVAAAAAEEQVRRLGGRRDEMAVELTRIGPQLEQAREAASTAQNAAEQQRIRAEDLEQQLRAHVTAGQAVVEAREALSKERKALAAGIDQTEAAERTARGAAAAAAAAQEKADAAAAEQTLVAREATERAAAEARTRGFVDEAEACLALLPPETASELRARRDELARRAAELGQTVRDSERQLEGRARPDLAALAAAAREAAEQTRAEQVRLGEARKTLAELERAREAVAARDLEYREVDGRLRTLGKLARVVGGENPLRMSLQRFVLAARMEEVAVAASERLALMSRGRYRLRRTDKVQHGGRGSGLDLLVEDAQLGADRSVHSLSGGEMFLASLALAMGLADTVQAHAGGIRLQSMFIDEGFGTLDDETLDQVMRTLEDLRAGGRLVGVISHVAELKERLPTRLTVHKGARGSWTELTV